MANNIPRRISFPEINAIAENLRSSNQAYPYISNGIGMFFGATPIISTIIKPNIPYIIEEPRFGLILKGNAQVSLNMIDYQVKANALVYMGRGSIIQIKNISKDLDVCAMMVSYEKISTIIEKAQSLLGNGTSHILAQVSPQEGSLACHMFEIIWELIHQKDFPEETLNAYIQALIHYYLHLNKREEDSSSNVKSHGRIMFEHFIFLLNRYCKEQHKIGFYADKMCVTPRYLGVVIKSVSGVMAKEWIDRAVVTNAKIMLRHTNKQITEISEELRFANPSFFCKFFKRMTGMRPQDYRKG